MQQQTPNISQNFIPNTSIVHYQTNQQNQSTLNLPLWGQQQIDQTISNRQINYPPPNILARNRRFQMLKRLRNQGYFEQEQIMLKFPHLHYSYAGKYKKNSSGNKFQSISQFLQSQIINLEYRRLIEKESKIGGREKNKYNEGEGDMLGEEQSKQMQSKEQKQSPFEQKLELISQEDLSLEQQALIDYIQQQFIQGYLPGFNYEQIDNDFRLDNGKQIDEDEEQKYFNEKGCNQQNQQVDDPQNNTNIQDF